MQKIVLGVLLGLLFAGCSAQNEVTQQENYSASEIIKFLSSDDLEGRRPGTEGMTIASSYVENYLEEIGVEPYFGDSYRDSVTIDDRSSYNIVGLIPAVSETDEYVLIGAHLDHLGIRGSGNDTIFNGANDDASGVTAVLKVAEELKKHDLAKNAIISIFTEEESGLNGARHLAKRLKSDSVNLAYVINFEMIGKPLTSDSSKVYITGFDQSNFAEVANGLLGNEFVKFEQMEKDRGLFRGADNFPFFVEFNIPSHTLSTFDFANDSNYHRPGDEFENMDINHMENIIDRSSEMIIKLLDNDAEITLYAQ